VERAVRQGEPVSEAWKKGIFSIWCASEQVQPLLGYLQETRLTDRPLEIAGMDCQMTGEGSALALREDLEDAYRRAGKPEHLAEAFATMHDAFDTAKWSPLPDYKDINYLEFGEVAWRIINELKDDAGAFASTTGSRDRALLARALTNYAGTVEMVYWGSKSRSDDAEEGDMQTMANVREPLMAETMVWLARERYPDRKLIVWAASSHLAWGAGEVEWGDGEGGWQPENVGWHSMGNHVREELGEDFYVINPIAYEGEIGSVAGWSRPLEAAPEGSIDALCHETGLPYLFVDMRSLPSTEGGAWLQERLVARPRGYGAMRAKWGDICDAFLFTNRMYPSTRVKPVEEAATEEAGN
jgi:erythromycin esterase